MDFVLKKATYASYWKTEDGLIFVKTKRGWRVKSMVYDDQLYFKIKDLFFPTKEIMFDFVDDLSVSLRHKPLANRRLARANQTVYNLVGFPISICGKANSWHVDYHNSYLESLDAFQKTQVVGFSKQSFKTKQKALRELAEFLKKNPT